MFSGAWPCHLLPGPDGRNSSIARHPRSSVRRTDRLGCCTDHLWLPGPWGRSLRCYWPPQNLPRESFWPSCVRDMHPQIAPLRWGSWAAYRRVCRVIEHSTLLYWNLPLCSVSLLCTWLCMYVSLIPWWLTPIPWWWAYGWRTLGPYGPDVLQVPLGCLLGFLLDLL